MTRGIHPCVVEQSTCGEQCLLEPPLLFLVVAVIRRPVNLVVTTVDESMSWLLRQLGRARPCAARALTRRREVVFHRQREWDSIRSRGHRMDTSTSAQVTIAVLLDGTLVCAHGVSRVNKASPEFSLRSHSIPAPRLDVVAQESVTVSAAAAAAEGWLQRRRSKAARRGALSHLARTLGCLRRFPVRVSVESRAHSAPDERVHA